MDEIYIADWTEWFFRHVYLAASRSKDNSTKIGAVLVRDKIILSEGYNGMVRGMNDNVPERYERPFKYSVFEHAERNLIYNAARNGVKTLDSICYTNSTPCADCCRGLIQAGVRAIYIHKQHEEKVALRSRWIESAKISKMMLDEVGIPIHVFDKKLNIRTLLDGHVIEI